MRTGGIKLILVVAVAMVGMEASAQAGAPGGFRTPRGGHHGGYGPVVRDHRIPPVVRDHRTPPVVVRDHRTPPVIRDHRAPWRR